MKQHKTTLWENSSVKIAVFISTHNSTIHPFMLNLTARETETIKRIFYELLIITESEPV
jgi:hypothetical protein